MADHPLIKKIVQDRAVRLACWAHNPKVKGSNPFLAKLLNCLS